MLELGAGWVCQGEFQHCSNLENCAKIIDTPKNPTTLLHFTLPVMQNTVILSITMIIVSWINIENV